MEDAETIRGGRSEDGAVRPGSCCVLQRPASAGAAGESTVGGAVGYRISGDSAFDLRRSPGAARATRRTQRCRPCVRLETWPRHTHVRATQLATLVRGPSAGSTPEASGCIAVLVVQASSFACTPPLRLRRLPVSMPPTVCALPRQASLHSLLVTSVAPQPSSACHTLACIEVVGSLSMYFCHLRGCHRPWLLVLSAHSSEFCGGFVPGGGPPPKGSVPASLDASDSLKGDEVSFFLSLRPPVHALGWIWTCLPGAVVSALRSGSLAAVCHMRSA